MDIVILSLSASFWGIGSHNPEPLNNINRLMCELRQLNSRNSEEDKEPHHRYNSNRACRGSEKTQEYDKRR